MDLCLVFICLAIDSCVEKSGKIAEKSVILLLYLKTHHSFARTREIQQTEKQEEYNEVFHTFEVYRVQYSVPHCQSFQK